MIIFQRDGSQVLEKDNPGSYSWQKDYLVLKKIHMYSIFRKEKDKFSKVNALSKGEVKSLYLFSKGRINFLVFNLSALTLG